MSKNITILILFLFVISLSLIAHGYTVVLKNGRIIKGTLLSETTDVIIFKDDAGVQYSLKKSLLNLDKMNETNQAASSTASSAPQEQDIQAPAPSKKTRVYTKEDLDRLKERYGELTTGTPIENPEDFSAPGVLKPEAYLRMLKESAGNMNDVIQNLNLLGSSVATQWEVASSTGKDPKQAIQSYLAGQSAVEIMNAYNSQISSYQDVRDRLGNPPKGFEDATKAYNDSLTALKNYYNLIRGYGEIQNSSVFKSRLDAAAAEAAANIDKVQSWQPASPEENTEPQTNPAPQTSPSETPQ